jgi:hypothetical protein
MCKIQALNYVNITKKSTMTFNLQVFHILYLIEIGIHYASTNAHKIYKFIKVLIYFNPFWPWVNDDV